MSLYLWQTIKAKTNVKNKKAVITFIENTILAFHYNSSPVIMTTYIRIDMFYIENIKINCILYSLNKLDDINTNIPPYVVNNRPNKNDTLILT